MKKLIAIFTLLASVCYGAYNYLPSPSEGEFVDWLGYKLWVASTTENAWLDPYASDLLTLNKYNSPTSGLAWFTNSVATNHPVKVFPTASTGITGGLIAGTNRFGDVAYYAHFDGADDYGRYEDRPSMSGYTNASQSQWVWLDTITNLQFISGKGNMPWGNTIEADGDLVFHFWTVGATKKTIVVPNATCNWNSNGWNFIAWTYSADADEFVPYVNDYAGPPDTRGLGELAPFSLQQNHVGFHYAYGGFTAMGLRDYQIYQERVLTGAEMTNLMQNSNPTNDIRILE